MSEQLVMQAGVEYRARNDQRMLAVGRLPEKLAIAYPWVVRTPEGQYLHYADNGRNLLGMETGYDLIAPWVDPPTPLEALKALREHYKVLYRPYYSKEFLAAIDRADAAIAAAESK